MPFSPSAFMKEVTLRNSNQPEFIQAVLEVADSLESFLAEHPKYADSALLLRMTEPERTIMFRIVWTNDKGEVEVNRGYRVQFSSALGPYKGGLRFHPSVNLSVLKFLGFEQVFKNSLTTLPLGGGKGGSDFDPKGRTDAEVMRFCQAFMTELARHIGADTDVPAGDIGVGGREIGYLYGAFKRISGLSTQGVLTGKGYGWGGSLIRPEATGFGAVYFAEEMLRVNGDSLAGKTVGISGSGNVAQGVAEKAIMSGATVVTLSDSSGHIFDKEGLTEEKLDFLKELKNIKRGRISEYAEKFHAEFVPNKNPWTRKMDVAFPSATQNELDGEDAKALIEGGVIAVVEGANMPTTPSAVALFAEKRVLFSPGKASNAGGVATSGLEMTQNSMRVTWTEDEVDRRLKEIMRSIHATSVQYGKSDGGYVDYVKGANIGGFIRVADAMIAQGLV